VRSKIAAAAVTAAVLAMPAAAQANTVHCGSGGDSTLAGITGKSLVPLKSSLTGQKVAGCWVADWVAYDGFAWWQAHVIDTGGIPPAMHHRLNVSPHDALRSEAWSYTFKPDLARGPSWDVTARCRRQTVTFRIWP
jgi:hypothetical protein